MCSDAARTAPGSGPATARDRAAVRGAGLRDADLVPRRGPDHLLVRAERRATTSPASGSGSTLSSLALRRPALGSVLIHELGHTAGRAARSACRSGGSACTCSAVSPRSARRRQSPARRPWSPRPARWSRVAARGRGVRRRPGARPGHRGPVCSADALLVSNLLVGVFNLLPGLPLDGGRVLAAAVWGVTGRRHSGAVVAAWVGRGVAVLVLFLPALLGPRARPASPTSSTWSGAPCSARSSGPARPRRCTRAGCSSASRACPPARSPGGPSRSPPTCRSPRRCGGPPRPVRAARGRGRRRRARWRWSTRRPSLATPENRRPWVPVGDVARRIQPDLRGRGRAGRRGPGRGDLALPASEYLVVEPTGAVFGVLATADVGARGRPSLSRRPEPRLDSPTVTTEGPTGAAHRRGPFAVGDRVQLTDPKGRLHTITLDAGQGVPHPQGLDPRTTS